MKKDALIIIAICSTAKRKFAIRTENVNNQYVMNWAFKINEEASKGEGFDENKISGSMLFDEEYPGCPHCGASGWYKCTGCENIICNDVIEGVVKCPECGVEGTLVSCDEFDLSGGTI